MHETKRKLLVQYGCRCMLCGEYVPYDRINWHHIKPKYVSKMYCELPDDSYENGSLLCIDCHKTIHKYAWWDREYQWLTDMILDNKADW